ncbi:pheromone-regulated membrane protein Prm10 [Coprinopsis sp. MPI-PUGE-AT-0042]|nr:pheromone-regulated membrane protein Prm10 [Coprinopsis sp. MPI-PUGE-AT-0042]
MPASQDTPLEHPPDPNSGIRTPPFSSSGFRTPRRVQWLDEHRSSDRATRMLDSSGVDAESFGNLVDSLEKHRKETPNKTDTPRGLTSKVHYYSHRPDRTGTRGDAAEHLPPQNDTSAHLEKHAGYDDRTPQGLQGHSSASRLHFPPPLSPEMNNDKDVDFDEPSQYSKKARWSSKAKAKQIVRHHSQKRQGGRKGDIGTTLVDPVPQLDDGATSDVDLEESRRADGDNGHPEMSGGGGGGGILSSLLELYRHQEAGSITPSEHNLASTCSSTVTSGFSTPCDSGWQSPSGDSGPGTPHSFDDGSRRKSRFPRPRLTLPSLGLVPRHKRARSGGGVIGALIATTGNLGGVAAPVNSQLQPDLTRPGFTLSRLKICLALALLLRPFDHLIYAHNPNLTLNYGASGLDPMSLVPRHSVISTPTSPLFHEISFDRNNEKQSPHKRPPVLRRASSFAKTFRGGSGRSTPTSFMSSTTSLPSQSPLLKPERKEKEKRRKRKKPRSISHATLPQIIRREEFLLKLTRAMMMFGAPTHRLQSQIQSAARVLDVQLSILYLPDTTLISFDDGTTGTSHVQLIRQASALDIGKLTDAFYLYWKASLCPLDAAVIHDKISVTDASGRLDELMKSPPLYNWWQNVLIGGMCSSAICTVAFTGSFIDALLSFPLGALLVAIQILSSRNQLYLHVFEITITMLFSFLSAAFAATHKFCYSAVGFLVLTAALELMSRNIVSGSIRLCYAVVYALFLGFGFAYGADIYQRISSTQIYGTEDYLCTASHDPMGPWYQRTPGPMWDNLKNGAPWNRKETLVLVLIACMGWTTNFFTGKKFVGQNDISAAVGAFTVGIVSNIYARIFSGNAFVVMVTGILFQLPNGLGSGGLLSYASQQASGSSDAYISAFMPTLKLIAVAMGLAIGLGFSLVVTYPIQSRRREAGIFSL